MPVTITRWVEVREEVPVKTTKYVMPSGLVVRRGPVKYVMDTFAGATGDVITKPVTVKDLSEDRKLVKKAEEEIEKHKEREAWSEFIKEESKAEHRMHEGEGLDRMSKTLDEVRRKYAEEERELKEFIAEASAMEHSLHEGEGIDRQARVADNVRLINKIISVLKEDLALADALAPRLQQSEYDNLVNRIKEAMAKLQQYADSPNVNKNPEEVVKDITPEIGLALMFNNELRKWVGFKEPEPGRKEGPAGPAAWKGGWAGRADRQEHETELQKVVQELEEGKPVTVKQIQAELGPNWETKLRWGFEKFANYAFFPIMLGNRAAKYLENLASKAKNPILKNIYWGLSKAAQGAGYVGAGVEVAGLTAVTGGAAGIAFAAIGAAQLADTLDRAVQDPIYHKQLEEFFNKLREGNPDAWADVAAIAAGMAIAGAGLKGLGDISVGDSTLSEVFYRNISSRFASLAQKARAMGYGKVASVLEKLARQYAERAGVAVRAKAVEEPEETSVTASLVKGKGGPKILIRYAEKGRWRAGISGGRVPEGVIRQIMKAYGVDKDTAEAAAYELASEYGAFDRLSSLSEAEREALGRIIDELKGKVKARLVTGTEYYGRLKNLRGAKEVMKAVGREELLKRLVRGSRRVYVSVSGDEYVSRAPEGLTTVRVANPKTGAVAEVVIDKEGKVVDVTLKGKEGTYTLDEPSFNEGLRRYGFRSLRDLLERAGVKVKGSLSDEELLKAIRSRYAKAVEKAVTRLKAGEGGANESGKAELPSAPLRKGAEPGNETGAVPGGKGGVKAGGNTTLPPTARSVNPAERLRFENETGDLTALKRMSSFNESEPLKARVRAGMVKEGSAGYAAVAREEPVRPAKVLGTVKPKEGELGEMSVDLYRAGDGYEVVRATLAKSFGDTSTPDDFYIIINRKTGEVQVYARSSASPAKEVGEAEALSVLRKYGFNNFEDLLKWVEERGVKLPKEVRVEYVGSEPKIGSAAIEGKAGYITVKTVKGASIDYGGLEELERRVGAPPALRNVMMRISDEEMWAEPTKFKSVAVGGEKGFARVTKGEGITVVVKGRKYYIPGKVVQSELYLRNGAEGGEYRVQVDWVVDVGSPEKAARFVKAFQAVKEKIIEELKEGRSPEEVYRDVRGMWEELMGGKEGKAPQELRGFGPREPEPADVIGGNGEGGDGSAAGEGSEEVGEGDQVLLMKVIRDIKERMEKGGNPENEIVIPVKNAKGGYAVAGAVAGAVGAVQTAEAHAKTVTRKEEEASESEEELKERYGKAMENGPRSEGGERENAGKGGATKTVRRPSRSEGKEKEGSGQAEVGSEEEGSKETAVTTPKGAGGKAGRATKHPRRGARRKGGKRGQAAEPGGMTWHRPRPVTTPEQEQSNGNQESGETPGGMKWHYPRRTRGQEEENAGSGQGQEEGVTYKTVTNNAPEGNVVTVTVTKEIDVQVPYYKVVQVPIELHSQKESEPTGPVAPPTPTIPPPPPPPPQIRQAGYVLPSVIRPPRRVGQREVITL